MLTQSLYTYLFQRDGRFFLYNSLTSLFAEISADLYEVLYNRDYGMLPENIMKNLIDKKVVCEESELYTYYLSQLVKFNATAYNQREAGLVIAPTLDCNFQCPYCFEKNKKTGEMSLEVQNRLIKYLKDNEDIRRINLTWYGGEPLLSFNVINRLYDEISHIDGKTISKHSIITNGFLITDAVIGFINTANVNSIQITVDGTRQHHDATRCTKGNGKPTFDRIMENIGKILTNCPEVWLNLRVNISRGNMEDFFEVFKTMRTRFQSDRLYVYPGFIRKDTADGCGLCYDSVSQLDALPFYRNLKGKGIDVDFIPREVKSRGCMMQSANSFIVGPEGELYKCWNDVGDKKKATGYIGHNKIENKGVYFHMMTQTSQFSDPECKDCLHFPTCGGGCGWYRSRNLRENGRFSVCVPWKDNRTLEDALLSSLDRNTTKYNQKLSFI